MSNSLPTIPIHDLKANAASRSTTLPVSTRTRICTGPNGLCALVAYPSAKKYCPHWVRVVRHCCGGKVSPRTGAPVLCAPDTPRLAVLDAVVDVACAACEEAEKQRRRPRKDEARRRHVAAREAFVMADAERLQDEQAALFAEAAARHSGKGAEAGHN